MKDKIEDKIDKIETDNSKIQQQLTEVGIQIKTYPPTNIPQNLKNKAAMFLKNQKQNLTRI